MIVGSREQYLDVHVVVLYHDPGDKRANLREYIKEEATRSVPAVMAL